jgi:hypothetical protein
MADERHAAFVDVRKAMHKCESGERIAHLPFFQQVLSGVCFWHPALRRELISREK